MSRTELVATAAAVFGLVLGTTSPAGALSKCTASKLKAAGKNIQGGLNCDSKAQKKGTAGGGEPCEAKPDATLVTAFTKADSKGACTGNAATVHGLVETCESAALAAVGANDANPVLSKCDSKKTAAMGKKAASKLNCLAKQASKGTDPTACLAKANVKFSTAIGKAVTAGDCSNASDATVLEPVVDNSCLTPVRNEIFPPPCPTTTFDFTVNSAGGGAFNDSSWPGGDVSQGTANCTVTVTQPSGDVVIVGTLGDSWQVKSFGSGFSSCVLSGACQTHGTGSTCTSCTGVDAPSSCPPAGIAFCNSNRPTCSAGLNGNATASAHVLCSP
jgi:hypothetical protein